jgi:Phage head-tail joining protein.
LRARRPAAVERLFPNGKGRKKVYASVEMIDTSEQTEDNNIIALTSIEITTYRQSINQRWRIEYNDEIYNITAITPYIGTVYCKINAVKIMQNGK